MGGDTVSCCCGLCGSKDRGALVTSLQHAGIPSKLPSRKEGVRTNQPRGNSSCPRVALADLCGGANSFLLGTVVSCLIRMASGD